MSTHPKKTESSAISENAAQDFVKPERARVNVQLAVRASERERLKGLAAEHGLTLNAYVSRCAQTPGRLATLPSERGEREARTPRREGGEGYEKGARAGRTMSVRLDADVYEAARAEAERERMSLSRWLRARALAGPAEPHPLSQHLDSPDACAAAVEFLRTVEDLDKRFNLRLVAEELRERYSHGTKGLRGAAALLCQIMRLAVDISVKRTQVSGSPSEVGLSVTFWTPRHGNVQIGNPPPEARVDKKEYFRAATSRRPG